MSHKAGIDFFETKREWSKKKDRILTWYLKPYLARVKDLKRPIVLVDGFAGSGKFEDGQSGSPLLLCGLAEYGRSLNADVEVICVEQHRLLFDQLKDRMSGFGFAEAIRGKFSESLDAIRQKTCGKTVFLYVDPYTYKGLSWDPLLGFINDAISNRQSIEILLNWNAQSFVRAALGAVKREIIIPEEFEDDAEEIDCIYAEDHGIANLSEVVGGDWWREIIEGPQSFPEMVMSISQGVLNGLREQLSYACSTPIKAKLSHRVAKYHLIFGSARIEGLSLMNDSMATHRGEHELFDNLFASDELRSLVLTCAATKQARKEIIASVIQRKPSVYKWSEIRTQIENLLRDGYLCSETGKIKINDEVIIWRSSKTQDLFFN